MIANFRSYKSGGDLIYVDKTEMQERRAFRSHCRMISPAIKSAECDLRFDAEFIDRIIVSYKRAQSDANAASSIWADIISRDKIHIHDALIGGDLQKVGDLLNNPYGSNLLYGFEGLGFPDVPTNLQYRKLCAHLYDNLYRLAEITGSVRLDYAEAPIASHPTLPDVDTLAHGIREVLGEWVTFPNPFPFETGIEWEGQVISHRAVQAVYQTKLILSCTRGSILEIGAGLGRNAYYAYKAGHRDYTIVDLPITNVAQACFLARTIGPDKLSLYGEPDSDIKIIPPSDFFIRDQHYDTSVNVDSITEMSREVAERYFNEVSSRSRLMVSVNHEFNHFTFRDLYSKRRDIACERNLYPLRPGYVQEIVHFNAR